MMTVNQEIAPGDYIYTRGFPIRCQGHRYRAHRMVMDVPTYQKKILVEALTGPDAGLWFVCSINFQMRYELVENTQPQCKG